MPAAPLAWFREQMFDTNGDPLSSGTLEFYESGTSTPLAVYSDADLSVSAGTTVTLNAAGFPQVSGSEVTLFLLPQVYRIVVKNSAGTTLRTVDGIYALSTASSSNLDISDAVAGEALSAGEAIYCADSSGGTAGRWYRMDADNTYSSTTAGKTGFATAAASSGATFTVRIAGKITGLSGLTAGEKYYASATAGALTATPPTNARYLGEADTTTSLVIDGGAGALVLPDSDGTHSLVIKTTSDLTADRLLTFVTGDANRTVTLGSDVTTTGAGTLTVASGATNRTVTLVGDVTLNSTSGMPRVSTTTVFETAARFTETNVASGDTTFGTSGIQVDSSATISSSSHLQWAPFYVPSPGGTGGLFTVFPTEWHAFVHLNDVGTDFQTFVGLGAPTVGGAGITYTVNHIGFKITRAASGAINLVATQADGTETASSALTTVASGDGLELALSVDSATSVRYWWRKNGGAWSAPTTLTTNVPTAADQRNVSAMVSNAGVATRTSILLGAMGVVR